MPLVPAERSCRESRWRPAHQARVFRPGWGCPAASRTSGSHLAHGRWVALSAGLPGISRRAASILWSGRVTPPRPRIRLAQAYYLERASAV